MTRLKKLARRDPVVRKAVVKSLGRIRSLDGKPGKLRAASSKHYDLAARWWFAAGVPGSHARRMYRAHMILGEMARKSARKGRRPGQEVGLESEHGGVDATLSMR